MKQINYKKISLWPSSVKKITRTVFSFLNKSGIHSKIIKIINKAHELSYMHLTNV